MENKDILQLWKHYDEKLNKSLAINQKMGAELADLKIRSVLSSMKPIKWFTLLLGIAWVFVGSTIVGNLFLNALQYVSPYFLISASLQLMLTAFAIVVYIYQLILIGEVDLSRPIIDTQQHLAKLQSSTLWVTRILFLQLPLWTTFFWSQKFFEGGNWVLLLFSVSITMAATALAVWLFYNIDVKNSEKKWFRLLFSGKEWAPLEQAAAILKEAELFQQGVESDQ
jgi:hypothetical protein